MPKTPGQSVALNSKQQRREETRAAILEAAARIFSESGLDGARTDAIAAAAGVNKALLYYYFKSKVGLYLAVTETLFRDTHEQMMAALLGKGSARAALLAYVSLHFDSLSRRPRMASLHQRMFMSNAKRLLPLLKKFGEPRVFALAKLIKRGIDAGEFRPVNVRQTTASLTALIVHYFTIGPVFTHLVTFDPYSPEVLKERKAALLDFIRHALFADPDAPLS